MAASRLIGGTSRWEPKGVLRTKKIFGYLQGNTKVIMKGNAKENFILSLIM